MEDYRDCGHSASAARDDGDDGDDDRGVRLRLEMELKGREWGRERGAGRSDCGAINMGHGRRWVG